MTNNNGKRKNHRLTIEAQVKAVDFLRANASRYREEQPSYSDVAEELTKAVSCEVKASNVQSLAKAANVDWLPQRPKPETPDDKDLASLAKAVADTQLEQRQLRNDIAAMAKSIASLRSELGVDVSVGLRALCDRRHVWEMPDGGNGQNDSTRPLFGKSR